MDDPDLTEALEDMKHCNYSKLRDAMTKDKAFDDAASFEHAITTSKEIELAESEFALYER
jgi:hypothetical protein